MMYRSWEITKNMITSVFISSNYAAVRFDWSCIPHEYRDELVRDFFNHEIEYDDQWFFASIVIPIRNNYLDFSSTYLYVDEYAPDEHIIKLIDDSVADCSINCLDLMRAVNVDVSSKIVITSVFMDNNK